MVAGSRSSLRRPTLRGQKSSRSNSPINNEPPPPLLPTSGNEGIALRSKRHRATTIATPEHDLKRRRLSTNKSEKPQLRIPLRSRGGLPKALSPPPATAPTVVPPKPAANANTAHINNLPIDSPISPGEKSQYDQIKIIEEKARAAIRAGGLSTNHEERRKLRSEDGGSRAKTELAQYFPDFEEMLSLKPPDPDALTIRTKVVLVDDTPDFEPPPSKSDPFGAHKPLHNTQIILLGQPDSTAHHGSADPLGEDVYVKIHAKAERHEKQMKNSDRERAQHEKYQLEKLLDDLRGPDWLKTLGISGITETEKRRYEPKRLLFIRETQALIDKFKRWKEEEKRRKLEREQELLEAAVLEDEDGQEEQDEGEDADNEASNGASGVEEESLDSASTHAPNSSELDALASQQLIEEAKIAHKRRKPTPSQWVEPPAPKPFTSFFDKRHLRDAAVAGRQRGRTILAFGHPIPDFSEEEFELPDDILTDEAIKARQRSHRRLRRGAG
ncbi:uncharacterized protein PV07_11258 [Cladophialophora immunda]|uniref:Something about silencing protein 4 domain-containing protein n=1 Tax=Cladophialophora immunda TaxID=569365 RepID=A0A0D1Z644_9EURO|nr:uncharacterized protein PV07_11258 [Cladophialophora immunda]KIW23026.1 hypothetical protein PV07_11258 [Cladophialophora immunda]OQU93684.1 hypothetical protein CLAIMM_00164 [Cladophialophora immunda]